MVEVQCAPVSLEFFHHLLNLFYDTCGGYGSFYIFATFWLFAKSKISMFAIFHSESWSTVWTCLKSDALAISLNCSLLFFSNWLLPPTVFNSFSQKSAKMLVGAVNGHCNQSCTVLLAAIIPLHYFCQICISPQIYWCMLAISWSRCFVSILLITFL